MKERKNINKTGPSRGISFVGLTLNVKKFKSQYGLLPTSIIDTFVW